MLNVGVFLFILLSILIQFHSLSFQEECKGHSEALGKQIEKYEVVREKRRSAKLKPNVHIEDRLVHLTTKDVWD